MYYYLPTCQPWLSKHQSINYIRCLTILLCNNQKKARGAVLCGLWIWPIDLENTPHFYLFLIKELFLSLLIPNRDSQLYSHRKHNWCPSFMLNTKTKFRVHSVLFSSSSLGMLDAALAVLHPFNAKKNKQRGQPFTSCMLADCVRLKLTSGTVFYINIYLLVHFFSSHILSPPKMLCSSISCNVNCITMICSV